MSTVTPTTNPTDTHRGVIVQDDLKFAILPTKFTLKCINFYGGPCSGKSTVSLLTTGFLKLRGHNADYISEYAKKLVYEENDVVLANQNYIFSKSLKQLMDKEGKVDIAVLDSPLLLSNIYGRYYPYPFKATVNDMYNRFDNLNIFLNRPEVYKTEGRLQNKEQAIKIDKMIKGQMEYLGIPYVEFQATPTIHEEIIEYIESWLVSLAKSSCLN